MARHKKSSDASDSMDSLMDALTNVVAVLIVVLLLLQVDVEQTVNKMFDELPPATAEQVELAKRELQEADASLATEREMLAAPAPTEARLEEIRADLALLEKSIQESKARLIELERLRKLAAEAERNSMEEKKKTDERLARIRDLEALLDQTPRPKEATAAIVSIPESREIPERANILFCSIHGDQAHLIDMVAAREMVMKEFDTAKKDFTVERVRERGERTRLIYNQDEVVGHFAKKELKIRGQTVTVPYNRPWTRLHVRVSFDPAKGDASLEDMRQPNGRFHRVIDFVKNTPRAVLIFKVHPNGFATYLEARRIADEKGLPCGWEVDGNPFAGSQLDFEVARLEQPPPSTQIAPPPKRTLD